jgi:two-component system response regulator AdeR
MKKPLAFVIEDDELIGEILTIALSEAHYQPVYIRNGKEALERLSTAMPDLVVLDLHLPKLPGITILRAIRSDTRLTRTRIMIVTADAVLAENLQKEADLVLVKPVGFNQIREMAERLRPNFNLQGAFQAAD